MENAYGAAQPEKNNILRRNFECMFEQGRLKTAPQFLFCYSWGAPKRF